MIMSRETLERVAESERKANAKIGGSLAPR
jgi:hypothetical protein